MLWENNNNSSLFKERRKLVDLKKIGQSFSCFKCQYNVGKTIISKNEKLLLITKKKKCQYANKSHLIDIPQLINGLHFLSAKSTLLDFMWDDRINTDSALNLCENLVNVTKQRYERWHKDPRPLCVEVFLYWMLTAYSSWFWSQLMNRYQARRIAK